jgi:hypothetical protein
MAADSAEKNAGLQPRKGLKRKYLCAGPPAHKIGAESPVSGAFGEKRRKCARKSEKVSRLYTGAHTPGS